MLAYINDDILTKNICTQLQICSPQICICNIISYELLFLTKQRFSTLNTQLKATTENYCIV